MLINIVKIAFLAIHYSCLGQKMCDELIELKVDHNYGCQELKFAFMRVTVFCFSAILVCCWHCIITSIDVSALTEN